MNDSIEQPLHDALHAHVLDSGDDAGAHLVGLADGALRVARRRQRLARVGAGVVTAAVVATAWMAVADGATSSARVVRPAAGGDTGKAVPVSLLPVTSAKEHACTDGGYTVPATATQPAGCVQVDRARGMTDVRVTSAKAEQDPADGGAWLVEMTLSPTDRARFAALTGSIASAPLPRNEFAIVIDNKLWGTPYVRGSITGGHVVIARSYLGDLTSDSAHDLAHRLDPG